MQLRPYQQTAVNAVYDYLRDKEKRELNPCVVAPTASGKTLMIAQIVKDAVEAWEGRVLLVTHVKELVEQGANKIQSLCPNLEVGIHSASLGRYDTKQKVIVASIQSIYQKAALLGHFDLMLVDEAHLLPESGEGRYRTFFAEAKTVNPRMRIVGFTATPYRLNGGNLCKPGNILNEVCYDIKVTDLLAQGYVSKLISKEGEAEADLSELKLEHGEFVTAQVDAAMRKDDLVERTCKEIVEKTRKRRHVLLFCASVAHCKAVAEAIARLSGEECPIVTGDTPQADRADLLERFKGTATDDLFGTVRSKPLKYLANVNVLTTGFDAPNIDCVVLLRPTASTSLYVQMVGRGFRLAPGKTDCLILDYGGNVVRHGPVNDLLIANDGPEKHKPPRRCPKCRTVIPYRQQVCPECGYVFPPPEERKPPKLSAHSTTKDIIGERKKANDITYTVLDTHYFVHRPKNPDSPDLLRIEMTVAEQSKPIRVWKFPEGDKPWQKRQWANWWRGHCYDPSVPIPWTAKDAVAAIEVGAVLRRPITVVLRYIEGKPIPKDIGYNFAPEPTIEEALSASDDNFPF